MVVARVTLDTTARDVFTAIVAFHPFVSLLSFVVSFFLSFLFFFFCFLEICFIVGVSNLKFVS